MRVANTHDAARMRGQTDERRSAVDACARLFVVLADGDKLQGLCDRYLNKLAVRNNMPYRIDPLMGNFPGIVNIQLLRYSCHPASPPDRERGEYPTRHELSFTIPVILSDPAGKPLAVGGFAPYRCADDASALPREEKDQGVTNYLASFEVPPRHSEGGGCRVARLGAASRSVDASGSATVLFDTHCAGPQPLAPPGSWLTAARTAGDDYGLLRNEIARHLWPFGPVEELYGCDQQFSVDDRVLELLMQGAGSHAFAFAAARFPGKRKSGRTPSEALMESSTRLLRFHAGGLLKDTAIRLHGRGGADIAGQLGLDVDDGVINPLYGIWYRADFELNKAHIPMEKRGARRRSPGPPNTWLGVWAKGNSKALALYAGLANAWLQAWNEIDRPVNRSGPNSRRKRKD